MPKPVNKTLIQVIYFFTVQSICSPIVSSLIFISPCFVRLFLILHHISANVKENFSFFFPINHIYCKNNMGLGSMGFLIETYRYHIPVLPAPENPSTVSVRPHPILQRTLQKALLFLPAAIRYLALQGSIFRPRPNSST